MTNQSRGTFEKWKIKQYQQWRADNWPDTESGSVNDLAMWESWQAALSEGRRLGLEEAEIVADTDATKSCNLTGRRIAKAIRALIVGGGEGANG